VATRSTDYSRKLILPVGPNIHAVGLSCLAESSLGRGESLVTRITLPELAVVVLIGPSGAGKSTFARTHFRPTEILSSDACRAMLSDDENDQTVTPRAFALLHHLLAQRLTLGRLTVIDATNVQPEARKPLVDLAHKYHVLPVAVVLDLPKALCRERNAARPDRPFGPHVIRNHRVQRRRSLKGLPREGFRQVVHLSTPEEIAEVAFERVPLWTNRRHETGPFDLIGDIHGCADELEQLLDLLDYERDPSAAWLYRHPAGRRAVFLGDLVDRGPRILDTCRIVMAMTAAGTALCVPGNHDAKLLRKLRGRDVQITHGLAETLAEIEALPPTERETFVPALVAFLDGLVSHFVLDGGKLVVAHAGLREEMHGRASGRVRDFALYGETTGEIDSLGLPVRHNWAAEYRGKTLVAYGHTPVPEPLWLNETVNLDTGCVFGGHLSAYYRTQGVPRVVCEEKHMGSRPVLVLCRDADTARERFGITTGEAGIVLTRKGRRFFTEAATETVFLDRLRQACTAAGCGRRYKAAGCAWIPN
jgi:protein phosphatase